MENYWWHKTPSEAEGKGAEVKQKRPRPSPKRTPYLIKKVKAVVRKHQENNDTPTKAEVIKEVGARLASDSTVKRILDFHCPLAPTPQCCVLTEAQREARLEFCKAHAGKTAEDWCNTVFCDEVSFEYGTVRNRKRCPQDPKKPRTKALNHSKTRHTLMAQGQRVGGTIAFPPLRFFVQELQYKRKTGIHLKGDPRIVKIDLI